MTPQELEHIHAACFPARPWRADELRQLIEQENTICIGCAKLAGFALAQFAADEAELLTIAVAPDGQGKGTGAALLSTLFQALAQRQVSRLFLEVAEDNAPARTLYSKVGFQEVARRAGYYPRAGTGAADALVLARDLADLTGLPHGSGLRIG